MSDIIDGHKGCYMSEPSLNSVARKKSQKGIYHSKQVTLEYRSQNKLCGTSFINARLKNKINM